MATLCVPHFAPIPFLLYLLSFLSPLAAGGGEDVMGLLSQYQSLSSFTTLLATTSVAANLINRSSLTILAVQNSSPSFQNLSRCYASSSGYALNLQILLEYISPTDLSRISPAGRLVSTLSQAVGDAPSGLGAVNITRNPLTRVVSVRLAASNSTLTSTIASVPDKIIVYAVDRLLVPCGVDLTASETRPPSSAGLNITRALMDGHVFNVAAAMLAASGLVDEFEKDQSGAGLTLFMPTDEAFGGATVSFQSLPADKKAVVLRFHVLHSYYPLGSLESIVNPVQPTLATEAMGAGRFTLNISKINESVAISTGIVQAAVTQTVSDQKPLVVFGISMVLLPTEIFGKHGGGGGVAPPPVDIPPSPDNSPESYSPPSRLSSPPGIRDVFNSGATTNTALLPRSFFILALSTLCCIGWLSSLV